MIPDVPRLYEDGTVVEVATTPQAIPVRIIGISSLILASFSSQTSRVPLDLPVFTAAAALLGWA